MILLANIGNRNISVDGKFFNEISREENRLIENHNDFRAFTRNLLESPDNFLSPQIKEEYSGRIELNIIDKLLKKHDGNISQIVLFYTNQKNEQPLFQKQDTVYEALVMKCILLDLYGLPVELREVDCNVTDNENLLKIYRMHLKQLKFHYKNSYFLICDAGGTAQQKAALKIISEFLFEQDTFNFEYVNFDGRIESVPQIEYRKIIESEQILKLITYCQYLPALDFLTGSLKPEQWSISRSSKLLAHAYYRLAFIGEKAHYFASNEVWGTKNHSAKELLLSYYNGEPLSPKSEFVKELGKEYFFYVSEIFAKTQQLYYLKNIPEFILQFSVFAEVFSYALVSYKTRFDVFNDYENATDEILKHIDTFEGVAEHFAPEPVRKGFPLILLCARSAADSTSAIIDELIQLNSLTNPRRLPGLDSLRNKYAHMGKGIDERTLTREYAHIVRAFKNIEILLGMPQEINVYNIINEHLKDYILGT